MARLSRGHVLPATVLMVLAFFLAAVLIAARGWTCAVEPAGVNDATRSTDRLGVL